MSVKIRAQKMGVRGAAGWLFAAMTMLGGAPHALPGQSLGTEARTAAANARALPPSLPAHRVDDGEPRIDGILDEAAWARATVAGDFVVFEPNEGERPLQQTEARVLYGSDAIFVGFRAYDSAPDSLVAQLARRDERPHSDWVDVAIDSYHDRRTAFRFGVNPAGVKSDSYMYNDVEEDDSWDAVWDVATRIDEEGWTAEFRIPYSQLRFDGAARQTWGINFVRFVARHMERSLWAPISREDGALVSRFGELRELRDLSPPARIEVMPYSLVRMEAAPGSAADPFYEPRDLSSAVGADVKYGLTTDLTLDLTLNPDFGQVEADPAQVNLSAFETFLPERRPFFLEGANIFDFRFSEGDGDGANEGLFYSRRIGRAPRGQATGVAYAEAPERTRILGAAKLSGKTQSGWSLGLLHALTAEENAQTANASGPLADQLVEPAGNHGMARLVRDFRDGRSAVGIISTWTTRDRSGAAALDLHDRAYTGGIDARHRFGDDRFMLQGYILGSTVRGSADAIARTQRSSARYFQRPDADHTEFDPARTSLGGWAASALLGKIAGGYWRFMVGATARSPGFDSNDLGFMRETDFVSTNAWIGYQHYNPTEHLQNWNLNFNIWAPYSLGGEAYQRGANINGSLTFKNFWGGYAGILRESAGLSNTALRGGPMLRQDPAWAGWFGFWTDSRKALQARMGGNWGVNPDTDSHRFGTDANLRWRPSSRATISAGPFVRWTNQGVQWIGRLARAGSSPGQGDTGLEHNHYLFGRLDQTTAGMTARIDWTFTPTLSLQLYAQPFVSAGRYTEFRLVASPRAERFADRFDQVATRAGEDGRVLADANGDGIEESYQRPDFNVKQLRSNAVLRWEYRTGSTLFLVWSQGRDHYERDGHFSFGRDLGTLFEQPGADVFMIKLSYWLG